MKKSEALNIFTGILLVLLAAFFSISLLVQFLNFGNTSSGASLFLFQLGKILASVYGLCSILIPVFLLAAAVLSFSTGWTVKNGTSLLLSFFPFFTAVLTERICRSVAEYDNGPLLKIKILSTVVIGFLIIVIEYLFFGILGQKVSFYLRNKGNKIPQPLQNNVNKSEEQVEERKIEEENILPVEKRTPSETTSVFDHVFDSVEDSSVSHTDEVPEAYVEPEKNVVSEAIGESIPEYPIEYGPDDIVYNPEVENKAVVETKANIVEPIEVSVKDEYTSEVSEISEDETDIELSESMEDVEENPALESAVSLITPEEYDALTQPLIESDDGDKNAAQNENVTEVASFAEEEPSKKERILDPDFFDVDLTQDDESEDDAEARTSDFRTISNVFAEMDEDARHELEENPDAEIFQEDKTISDDNNLPEEDIIVETFDDNSEDADASDEVIPDFPAQMLSVEDFDIAEEENVSGQSEEQELDDDTAPEDKTSAPIVIDTTTAPPLAPVQKKFRGAYKIPVENLLTEYADDPYWVIDDETKNASIQLKETLSEFKIDADIIGIRKGPVVTMFEMLPAPGVKLSKIVALQDNIALRLAASSVRIVAPIPGKQAVGIEIPNKNRAIVGFREIIEQDLPEYKKMAVPVILGKDIEGEPQIMDLVKTPHLLIAGATGSGKSVCVNSMILSILYKRSPQEVKLLLIDPKIVELKLYNNIPHLLTPVITEAKKAFQALQYCLCEMERRYALLDGLGVRDISSYNKRIAERKIATEKLPYIVVIIDEFADLMATTGKELESTVARLAAMSRAIGIHIVLATQRPSIDVITGLIKANIPTRIAFMVASKMDSRIIIDQVGAEKLLGRGDMLYASAVDPFPIRIQGTFVSDNEVENVVEYVKQYGPPDYIDDEIFVDTDDEEEIGPSLFNDGDDPLYEKALDIVVQAGKASASYIQRRLKIGYNRAARLVEEMEDRGIVGPQNGSKPREIIHIP